MYFISPRVENSVDPDQLASQKPADLDLHCFQNRTSMLPLVIGLVNIFNRTRVYLHVRLILQKNAHYATDDQAGPLILGPYIR